MTIFRCAGPCGRWLVKVLMLVSALSFAAMLPAGVRAADGPATRIAVFDIELADTSGEPLREAHAARIQRSTEVLRQALADTGRYVVVDVAPAAERIAGYGYLRSCNGCEVDIAESLGADQALVATVHKISSLILYIAVVVSDVKARAPVFVGTVSIRGDTDEAWERGARYIVRNKIMDGAQPGNP